MLDYAALTAGVAVDLAAGKATAAGAVRGVEDVIGTQAADTLTGSDVINVLLGNGGTDRLLGLGGDDVLVGGDGDDVLDGGDGRDVLIGGRGATTSAAVPCRPPPRGRPASSPTGSATT